MSDIFITPYNPEWEVRFKKEAKILYNTFADKNPIIEHIGSTSVVGLDAKPIIDIMVGFQKLEIDEVINKIEALGYEHWREDPFRSKRLFFTKWDSSKKNRLMHIHATTIGNDFWTDQLNFRTILRSTPTIAKEYALLKKDLANRFKDDRDGYTAAKTEFIRRILAQ